VTADEDEPIDAIEMTRRIRDAFYERTRLLSWEEIRALIAREAEDALKDMHAPRK